MNQSIQFQCGVCNVGLCLAALLCLWLAMSAPARADSGMYGVDMDEQAFTPANQYSANEAPVIVCGGQSGHRPASLKIRGADVATLWRKAYRMLFPSVALAEKGKFGRTAPLPSKGPAWSISVAREKALVTIQTKW